MKPILVLLLASGLWLRPVSAQTLRQEIPEYAGFDDRIPSGYAWLLHPAYRVPKTSVGFSAIAMPLPARLAPLAGVPQDYYTLHWGMMCRFEWNTYRRLKVPLSIRLGTLEYENRLEGKP